MVSEKMKGVKILDILANNEATKNAFLNVRVLWVSPVLKSQVHFILSDDSGYIHAILFFNTENPTNLQSAMMVYDHLQPNSYHRLQNMKFADKDHISATVFNHLNVKIKGHTQERTLMLSTALEDYGIVDLGQRSGFLKHLDLDFTNLEDIKEGNVDIGERVDVIGHVRHRTEVSRGKNDCEYQSVYLQWKSSGGQVELAETCLTMFGNKIGSLVRDSVCVILNAEVSKFYKLHTKRNTVIVTLNESNLHLLPRKFWKNSNNKEFLQEYFNLTSNQIDACCNGEEIMSAVVENGYQSSPKRPRLEPEAEPNLSSYYYALSQQSSQESLSLLLDALKITVGDSATANTSDVDGDNLGYIEPEIKGCALIIMNNYFPHQMGIERRWKHDKFLDLICLTEFFKRCNYDVLIKYDVSSKELPSVISNFKSYVIDKNYKNVGSCFVALLTHGDRGKALMVDDETICQRKDVMAAFGDSEFPEMKGKSKMFLFTPCQEMTSTEEYSDTEELKDMICFGTKMSRGQLQENMNSQSAYVYLLVKTFMEHSPNAGLGEMLKMVKKTFGKNACQQIEMGFNKPVYFNPCLRA